MYRYIVKSHSKIYTIYRHIVNDRSYTFVKPNTDITDKYKHSRLGKKY